MKMQRHGDETRAIVDWQLAGKADPFFGSGTTTAEKALVWGGVILFAIAYGYWLLTENPQPDWSWWQWVLVMVFVVDLAGGMIANSLNACKRLYHAPRSSESVRRSWYLNHQLFAAVHVHSLVLGFVAHNYVFGVLWYVLLQLAVQSVLRVPLYLQRPVSMLWVMIALVLNQYIVPGITGLEWFVPVLFLKIVYGHAVREEPYAPPGV